MDSPYNKFKVYTTRLIHPPTNQSAEQSHSESSKSKTGSLAKGEQKNTSPHKGQGNQFLSSSVEKWV